jgi:hypothetical protein
VLQQVTKGEEPAVLTEIRQLRAHPLFRPDRPQAPGPSEEERRAYWQALIWDIAQQAQGATDRGWGAQVAEALSLDTRVTFEIRRGIYRTMWQSLLEDHLLEQEEEASLQQMQGYLALADEEVREERAMLAEYAQARRIASADSLPTVEVDIPLHKAEVCHHRTEGELLDKRVARRYQQEGQQHVSHEWVPTKSGRCYITSKRILIVGQGTATVPHGKILDLEVDADDRIIEITKDGRQEPIYLRVADPIVTGAFLERLQSQGDDNEEIC